MAESGIIVIQFFITNNIILAMKTKKISMSHNARYATHTKYNYIVEWYQSQCSDIDGCSDIHRFIDTFLDYTAYGALAQFEKRHYINPTVISVYRHSSYIPPEV